MNSRRFTFETALYLLAFILALLVRLYNLGAAPLSDSEAAWALQALQIAWPGDAETIPSFGPQPAYIILTGISFALLGASDAVARLWPALVGALLPWLPFFFRRELGQPAALILAFGLALDPGLAASSRLVGGPGMALSFSLLALGVWQAGNAILAGVLLGLALLSGPTALPGLLSLGLTWVIFKLGRKPAQSDPPAPAHKNALGLVLTTAGITILLLGTLALRYPQALSGWAATLTSYLAGWADPSGVPAWRLLLAMLVYTPAPLIFAGLGIVRWLYRPEKPVGAGRALFLQSIVWALLSLVLILVYPGRQVADSAWILTALWVLAAQELVHYLPEAKISPISLIQGALLLLMGALFWATLLSTSDIQAVGEFSWNIVRLGMLLGILLLGVVTTILVYLGWSASISRDGLMLGAACLLVIYCASSLWGATQLRPNSPAELWSPTPTTVQERLFVSTLQTLSKQQTSLPNTLEIACLVDAPSMRWALRDFDRAHFVSGLPSDEMPAVVLTRQEQTAPTLTAAYRGQDFIWWAYPGWTGALPPQLVEWLTFRIAPLQEQQIILWARSDLFPGGEDE
ncbi:MAG: hypothetical protein JXB15_11415 [Anaerolineales bacterium]|nr:hypothetical protein [Anaerolineales bacterium]